MPYIQLANGTTVYVPWSHYFIPASNHTDIISAPIVSSVSALPWIFNGVLFMLYLVLFWYFGDSPSKYKFLGILAIVMIISLYFASFGLIANALLNIILFAVASSIIAFLKKTG